MTVTGNAVFQTINPLFVNIAGVYMQYWSFIDAVLAFMIFFSLSHWVFTKRFQGREGKMIAVALGTALTFAFAGFQWMSGFRLGGPEMQSVAGIVFMLILFLFLFTFFRELFKGVSA